MHRDVLLEFRESIRRRQYIVSLHAAEEMDDDELTAFDIEHCVLVGEVLERQRDALTGEGKFVIRGSDLEGNPIRVVLKKRPAGKMLIITVFRE